VAKVVDAAVVDDTPVVDVVENPPRPGSAAPWSWRQFVYALKAAL
jgi:hypothetical protein